ncbi:MAG: hypothetical protein IPN18_04970 [Ignavibacteriales bacterium]|nr:hypothetical protein [Ignavibacteriales bacterium]
MQNEVTYKIDAELLPKEGKVRESGHKLQNNFPNALEKLVIRLYQDAFKKGVGRDFQINPADVHDGTIISDFKIDGKEIDLKSDKINRSGTLLCENGYTFKHRCKCYCGDELGSEVS